MNKKIVFLSINSALVLLVSTCNAFTNLGAQANSAQRYFYGTSSTGALLKDADSPIIVTNEDLVFNVDSVPNLYDENNDNYSNTVSATYTFSNPSDFNITAGLAFPFSPRSEYLLLENYQEQLTKHKIKVNDQEITPDLRHTFYERGFSQFDVEKDVARLRDAKQEDDFFDSSTNVYKQTLVLYSDVNLYTNFYLELDLTSDFDGILLSDKAYYVKEYDATKSTQIFALPKGQAFELYFIGENIVDVKDKFRIYDSYSREEEAEGYVSQITTETISFDRYVSEQFDDESLINEIDQYNIIVDFLNYKFANSFFKSGKNFQSFESDILTWYDYQLTFAPGETLSNQVIAPLFPSVNHHYEPEVLEFTYLVTPASTWSSFANLNISINTEMYLIDAGYQGFTKVDDGYQLTLQQLPENELTFSLSTSENPEKPPYFGNVLWIIGTIFGVMAVLALAVIPITIGVVIYVVLSRRNRRK